MSTYPSLSFLFAAGVILFATGRAVGQTRGSTITFDGQNFTIAGHGTSETVPLSLATAGAAPTALQTRNNAFVFRKDNEYAVWDSRGLTIRNSDKAQSFTFEDFPVDPAFFNADQIAQARQDVASGKKKLAASGLSGARRIGQRAYFLVHWSDSSSKPWLEALVQVDLDSTNLKPKVLGRFAGLSGATSEFDNRLLMEPNGIAVVVQNPSDWGVATYSFASRTFDYVNLGTHLVDYETSGLYLERTSYNTTVGGELNVTNFQATTLFEDRGICSWLDSLQPPVCLLRHAQELIVRNCDTGLDQRLSPQAQVRRTSLGLLAWSPAQSPKHAVLLSLQGWRKLAVWDAGANLQSSASR